MPITQPSRTGHFEIARASFGRNESAFWISADTISGAAIAALSILRHITQETVWENLCQILIDSVPGVDGQTVSEAKGDFGGWIEVMLMMATLKLTVNEKQNAGLSSAGREVRFPRVYVWSMLLGEDGASLLATAMAAAQETGLPPKLLKNSMPLSKDAAIPGVVMTAASGKQKCGISGCHLLGSPLLVSPCYLPVSKTLTSRNR
jgi:hypothetical protein